MVFYGANDLGMTFINDHHHVAARVAALESPFNDSMRHTRAARSQHVSNTRITGFIGVQEGDGDSISGGDVNAVGIGAEPEVVSSGRLYRDGDDIVILSK